MTYINAKNIINTIHPIKNSIHSSFLHCFIKKINSLIIFFNQNELTADREIYWKCKQINQNIDINEKGE